jgi:hypothetical protein
MAILTARSSTIVIASRDKTLVYKSFEEVPVILKRKLQESTHGVNSATILIADKGGREELIRALQGKPSDVRCRWADTLRSPQVHEQATPTKRLLPGSIRTWIELLLPVAVGACLWAFIASRF